MRVTVLGSGSRGNAIAVQSLEATILLDAGFGLRTLTRRLEAACVSPDTVSAIVLTHEHGDHARGVAHFARRYGIPVLGSEGTLMALGGELQDVETRRIDVRGQCALDPFVIRACRTCHDAAEPLAVSVQATTSGATVGLAYDLGRPTGGLRTLLRDVHCLLLEANHDDGLLRSGPYPASVRRRIAGPGGHLSNRAAAALAQDVCHGELETVVLVHVSDACNEPGLARRAVREALKRRRFGGKVLVARQDKPLAPVRVSHPALQLSLGVTGKAAAAVTHTELSDPR